MASYSATIEVGTKGTAALEKLLDKVNTLSGSIDKVNRNPVFGSKQVASLNEYNRTLKEATANLAKTRVVLDKSGQAAGNYAKAIKDYADALGLANGAQDLTNKLVQQEIQGREKATAALKKYNAAAASARQPGGSMAGRYMRPGAGVSTAQAYSSPIGPEPSFVFSGQSTAVGGRIKAIKAAQAAMVAAETKVNRVTRTFEQQETAREKANDKLIFDRKMALLDAEHQKTLKLNKKENDAALKNFDQRLGAQTKKRAAKAKAQAGRSRKFRDIATGAGFPLLFGGGPIQALAGGLGGAAGGLGGAIAASAITAQVEAFAKDTAAVGQALNSTSGALELMREKSLFSTDAAKKLAAELEGLGEIEKLSTLLAKELVQKIGNEGVTALQDLGTESDKTTRLWSALTLQLQVLLAGPLKDFLVLVNSVLGAVTTSGRFKVLESELTGQARTDFDTDVASRKAANLAATASGATGASGMMSSMGTAGGVGVLSLTDKRELVEKYLPKLLVTVDIPVLEEDLDKATKQLDKAAKQILDEKIQKHKVIQGEIRAQTALLEGQVKIFNLQAQAAQSVFAVTQARNNSELSALKLEESRLQRRLANLQRIDKFYGKQREIINKIANNRRKQAQIEFKIEQQSIKQTVAKAKVQRQLVNFEVQKIDLQILLLRLQAEEIKDTQKKLERLAEINQQSKISAEIAKQMTISADRSLASAKEIAKFQRLSAQHLLDGKLESIKAERVDARRAVHAASIAKSAKAAATATSSGSSAGSSLGERVSNSIRSATTLGPAGRSTGTVSTRGPIDPEVYDKVMSMRPSGGYAHPVQLAEALDKEQAAFDNTKYLKGPRGAGATSSSAEGGYTGPINIKTGPVMQQDNETYLTMGQFEEGMRDLSESIARGGRSYGSRQFQGVS